MGRAVPANQDVHIPWIEDSSFDGVLDARRFYEAALPTISRLHSQAASYPSPLNELRTLHRHVSAIPAESVCDLGCGLGNWASVYGQAASRVHLVDLSPSILAFAMTHVSSWAPTSKVTCQVLDLFNEPDWISLVGFRMYLLSFVVGHATERQRLGALVSLRKAVCSEDRVVMIDSLKSDPRQKADTVRCIDIDGNRVGVLKHHFDVDEVRNLAHQSGFEVVSSWWGHRYFLVELR